MAKCYSCGKNFDYEKYYGICPKCGAYNRENTPEDEHKELHKEYDAAAPGANHYSMDGMNGDSSQNAYRMNGSSNQSAYSMNGTGTQKRKASPAGTVIFILLILGIIACIAVPIFFLVGRSMQIGMSMVSDIGDMEQYVEESLDGALEREIVHTKQNAEIIDWQTGEACFLGSNGEQEMVVEDARVLIPAGMVEGFPEDENLVAITVSYQSYYEDYYYYYAVEKFYVGYGENTFKEALEPYYLEEYMDVLGNVTALDAYEMSYENGQGEILVFVPEDVTSVDLYLESRNENTYELIEIYRIPLEIMPGEGI